MKLGDILLSKGKDYFYIMHLAYGAGREKERERLWNYAKQNRIIGLDLVDFVRNDWNDVSDSVKQLLRSQRPIWFKQFDRFCNEMTVDDLVMVLNGWDSLLGVAEISEPRYRYVKSLSEASGGPFFDHVRSVKWRRACDYDRRLVLPEPIRGFNNTLLKVKTGTKFWSILANVDI